jgi:hypothetical protein
MRITGEDPLSIHACESEFIAAANSDTFSPIQPLAIFLVKGGTREFNSKSGQEAVVCGLCCFLLDRNLTLVSSHDEAGEEIKVSNFHYFVRLEEESGSQWRVHCNNMTVLRLLMSRRTSVLSGCSSDRRCCPDIVK